MFCRWRANRPVDAMPAVLESTHPLMQKFQETLKQFLIKENAIAEEEILNLVTISISTLTNILIADVSFHLFFY